MDPLKRYFLDSDDSGHWYLVEAARREDWDLGNDGDSINGATPSYAQSLGHHPCWVTFSMPVSFEGEDL